MIWAQAKDIWSLKFSTLGLLVAWNIKAIKPIADTMPIYFSYMEFYYKYLYSEHSPWCKIQMNIKTIA